MQSSPEGAFDYAETKPIEGQGSVFRLLHLLGGTDYTIRCELFGANINPDGPDVPYEALSYVWGGSERSERIILNGKNFPITKNLSAALRNLRLENSGRVLWIDAICIDQNNNEERNHQLMHMTSIYQQAERVIFWLGETSYEIDLLLDALAHLERVANQYTLNSRKAENVNWSWLLSSFVSQRNSIDDYRIGMETILARPWFRRVWILQECAHARKAIIACGKKHINARIFALSPQLLGVKPEPHCQSVLDIMPGSQREGWWEQQRDLFTLITKFKESESTDPRDKAYALLSMATDVSSQRCPTIDYNLPLPEVLRSIHLFLFPYSKTIKWRYYGTFERFVHFLEEANNEAVVLFAKEGKCEIMRQLMGHTGFDPNYKHDRLTALGEAAGNGHVEAVKLLLERRDTNVNLKDSYLRTPISRALGNRHVEVAELLLEVPEVQLGEIDGQIWIDWAAKVQQCTLLCKLLRKNFPVTPIQVDKLTTLALGRNDTELMKALLKRASFDELTGTSPEPNSSSPTHSQRLIDARCNSIFTLLARNNSFNMNALDRDGKTFLTWAIETRRYSLCQELIQLPTADLDFRDRRGETAITAAVRFSNKEVVSLLKNLKILESPPDSLQKETLLDIAISKDDADMVRLLLPSEGVLGNYPAGKRSATILEWSISFNSKNIVKMLLSEKGVDIKRAKTMRMPSNLRSLLDDYKEE